MRPGEIYLAKSHSGMLQEMKLRPVLLLTGPVGPVPETVVAYISSVIPTRLLPSDLLLDPSLAEFRSTNLKTSSALRLHKLASIHCSSLARYLGILHSRTQSAVTSKLKALLQLVD
jgi:mRNA interferase MazF